MFPVPRLLFHINPMLNHSIHYAICLSQVRSLDKEKISESRVQINDLVDHLQGKLSSKPEATESSAPVSNKGQGTQSGNELNSSIVPEIKVSFNTQERMAWNIKKRYESLMMSKIKPLLAHIGTKNAVEVIGVRWQWIALFAHL